MVGAPSSQHGVGQMLQPQGLRRPLLARQSRSATSVSACAVSPAVSCDERLACTRSRLALVSGATQTLVSLTARCNTPSCTLQHTPVHWPRSKLSLVGDRGTHGQQSCRCGIAKQGASFGPAADSLFARFSQLLHHMADHIHAFTPVRPGTAQTCLQGALLQPSAAAHPAQNAST